jgi:hypothetical protein
MSGSFSHLMSRATAARSTPAGPARLPGGRMTELTGACLASPGSRSGSGVRAPTVLAGAHRRGRLAAGRLGDRGPAGVRSTVDVWSGWSRRVGAAPHPPGPTTCPAEPPLREKSVSRTGMTKAMVKRSRSLPLLPYSAPGGLRQDPHRAAESSAEAERAGLRDATCLCCCRRLDAMTSNRWWWGCGGSARG